MQRLGEASDMDVQSLAGHPDFQLLTRNKLLGFHQHQIETVARFWRVKLLETRDGGGLSNIGNNGGTGPDKG